MKTKKRLFSKRLIAIVLTAFMATTAAFAAQRSLEEMKSIAYAAFNLDNTQTDPFLVPLLDVKCKSSDLLDASLFKNDEEAFYIFAFTNGAPGYVIVSADTRLPEVIAYSASDHFHTDGMPEAVRAFFQSFVEKMNNTPESFVAKRRARGKLFANSTNSSYVLPLLGDIAFGQNAPYNIACPTVNGTRTVTGCVATAMAQIMKYHQHPSRMKGNNISYTTQSLGIKVTWNPSSTTFDWSKIRDTYTGYIAPYSDNETVTNDTYMMIQDVSYEENGNITLKGVYNISGETISGTNQYILTDNNGVFIRPLPAISTFSDLKANYGWHNLNFNPLLPASFSDGNYCLYIGTKKNGTSLWSYAQQYNNGYLQEFYLSVKKTGKFFTIEGSDYNYPCYIEEEAAEVAKLLAACGASVEMNYGTGASGASTTDAGAAFINNFSYDPSIEELSPSYFQTDDWHARIQKELQAHRPILVSGRADNNNGHAFIIDGYRYDGSTPYYHINWGWNGSDNAYFLIDNMRPSEAGTGGYTDNYSYDYTLFFGIQPENNIDEGIALSSSYTVDKSTYSAGYTIAFNISQLTNISCVTFSGTVKAYACSGNRCYELGSIISPQGLGPGYVYSNMTRSYTLPSTIPTGTYRIILKAQQTGSSVEKEVYATDISVVQIIGNYILGDVDRSGNVDISDVVMMVNYILGSDNSSSVLNYGDMDSSGNIDISDVVALVNLILGN